MQLARGRSDRGVFELRGHDLNGHARNDYDLDDHDNRAFHDDDLDFDYDVDLDDDLHDHDSGDHDDSRQSWCVGVRRRKAPRHLPGLSPQLRC
jgi:hypothetical protein